MTKPWITYHNDVVQRSDEWHDMRRGLITASEMKLLITPTLKVADNDKSRAHLYELLAQRIAGFTEPHFVSDDMDRGTQDEYYAREYYASRIAPVTECGFVTNDLHGFRIGYSPDGLVGDDGLVELKSRKAALQIKTILENVDPESAPLDFMLQCQTGLIVTERSWLDCCSYSNGLPMAVMRVWPDDKMREAILETAHQTEMKLATMRARYDEILASGARLIPTERRIIEEIY